MRMMSDAHLHVRCSEFEGLWNTSGAFLNPDGEYQFLLKFLRRLE
jgi:hypothetical protein